MMMDYSIYTKLAYCYCTNCFLLCLTIFRIDNFYVRGRECPRHSGLESLPLLRHCRDPMQSQHSKKYQIFKKVGDNYVIAANEHFVKKIYYLVYDRNHIYCIFFIKVSISTDKSDSYFPGNAVHFTVNSTKRSTVYLLTVDEGILHTQSVLDVNVQEVPLITL